MTAARESGTIERACRVLIADDDPAARRMLRAVLESAAFHVTEAHDGRELYDMLATSPRGHFHVVVADHGMPGLRGLEVLALSSSRSKFVILTGSVQPSLEEAAGRFGAAAFVRKPVEVQVFLRLIKYIAFGVGPERASTRPKRSA